MLPFNKVYATSYSPSTQSMSVSILCHFFEKERVIC